MAKKKKKKPTTRAITTKTQKLKTARAKSGVKKAFAAEDKARVKLSKALSKRVGSPKAKKLKAAADSASSAYYSYTGGVESKDVGKTIRKRDKAIIRAHKVKNKRKITSPLKSTTTISDLKKRKTTPRKKTKSERIAAAKPRRKKKKK